MIGLLLLLLLCMSFGKVATGSMVSRLWRPVRWSYFLVAGVALFGALSLAVSFLAGLSLGLWISVTLVVVLLFIKRSLLLRGYGESEEALGIPVLLAVCFLGLIFYRLLDTHVLWLDTKGNLLTGESTYGDLPFHLGIISQFVFLGKFPPENPLFAGRILAYPYLIDFFSALLMKVGASLRDAIIWPGMALGLSTAFVIYDFAKYVSRRAGVALLSLIIFFFHGGLGFYYFFKDTGFGSGTLLALLHPTHLKEYSHLFSENIQWANFLSRMIVPERSLLLGIPVGLIVLKIFLTRVGIFKVDRGLMLAAILIGLLPIAHTHTFLVVGPVVVGISLYELRLREFSGWFRKWASTFLLAGSSSLLGLFTIFLHMISAERFFKVHLLWMSGPEGPLVFWWKNLGLFMVLLVLVFFVKSVSGMVKTLAVFGLVVFGLVNMFQFQPYLWDDIKFLIWFAVFGSIAVSSAIAWMWDSGSVVVRTAVLLSSVTLVLSAALSIYRESFVQYQLFSSEDLKVASWVGRATSPKAVFLTAPIHNSPVSNLAGRRIFMGYPGMLWVHGISYEERENEVTIVYHGQPGARGVIRERGIDYIVFGPYEEGLYGAGVRKVFNGTYCPVYNDGRYIIYKTTGCQVI